MRVLLRNPQPFSLTDPKVTDGYVLWDWIWCPDCMAVARTLLVKNLFNRRGGKDSSSSESESEREEQAVDPESETPGVARVFDLTSPKPEERPTAAAGGKGAEPA